MCQRGFIELADPAVRADYEGKGERVPVAVGVGRFVQCRIRMQCAPVFAVIGGDVGAIGANGDPGFGGGVVGHGGAVAAGWRGGRLAFEMNENSFEIVKTNRGSTG